MEIRKKLGAKKAEKNFNGYPLPCWWRRCWFSVLIIPQNRGEGKGYNKNAFRQGEKLPYLFTLHYYLLPYKKSVHAELVKSEEWKVKK